MNPMRSPYRQHGVATLLVVVLIGLSLTAIVGGGIYYNRVNQEQAIALQAQTQAQAKAWAVAEVIREFLSALNSSQLQELNDLYISHPDDPIPFSLTNVNGTSAALTQLSFDSGSGYTLTARITANAAENTRASSQSTLEVVYRLTTTGNQTSTPSPDMRLIQFTGDLDISGDLKVRVSEGKTYEIVVDGNVTLGGLSTGGIDAIRSTKSIKFVGGSSSNFTEMHANCDVLVSNGVFSVANVKATRNVCLANTISSQSITANGSVEVTGGVHGDIRALANKPAGTAQCAVGATQWCTAAQGLGVKTNPEPTIGNIYSKANVELNSSVSIGNIRAENDLKISGCTPNWLSATYGGTFTDNQSCSRTATKSTQAVLLDPVPPVAVEAEKFDANALRGVANYVYTRLNNVVRVKIQGVTGIRNSDDASNPLEVRENGYYFRTANIIDPNNAGWTNRTVAGYACINNNDPKREDETSSHCIAQLGRANNISTPVPEFISASGKTPASWKFNGISHAPGIIFADGNISVDGGTYTNTFIATGNLGVTTAGGAVFAPNYAGPDGITANGYTALGVCNNSIYTFRPTELCRNTYTPSASSGIGNYALLAGSCPIGSLNNCTASEYIGGDIKVEKSVFGAVKAGNLFTGSASISIYGYISSLSQRLNGTVKNTIAGGATIDLRVPDSAKDRYDPSAGSSLPNNGGDGSNSGGGNESTTAIILWSRYL